MLKTSIKLFRDMNRRKLSEHEYMLMFRPFFIIALLCVCHIFTMATTDELHNTAEKPKGVAFSFTPTEAYAENTADDIIVVNNPPITSNNHSTLYTVHAISYDYGTRYVTDDGNEWLVSDMPEFINGSDVIITFDSMGTDELNDDKIIKIIPVDVEKG